MTTWTPRALASEARRYGGALWRVVEAQHTASTMRLTDSLQQQATLEQILEESKPAVPAAAAGLHYLLATPFRYRPPIGSRFRAPYAAGVWYGAEGLRTALAEKSYWRLRFLLDSAGTPDLKPVPHTAFRVAVRSSRTLDLTLAPLLADRSRWTSPTSYAATQALAEAARAASVQLIRYESVRDPQHAACAALLDPKVFGRNRPAAQQTWFIAASRQRVRCAHSGSEEKTWEFDSAGLSGPVAAPPARG